MEVYKLREFSKWAKREFLSDAILRKAVDEMNRGLIGDRLGSDIYKKRIGVRERGKRSGVRTIVLFKQGELAVFLFGYAKNERSDLDPHETEGLRIFAKEFLRLSRGERLQLVIKGSLVPINDGEHET